MQTKCTPHNIRTEDAKQCGMLTSSAHDSWKGVPFPTVVSYQQDLECWLLAARTTYQGNARYALLKFFNWQHTACLASEASHQNVGSCAFWSNVMPALPVSQQGQGVIHSTLCDVNHAVHDCFPGHARVYSQLREQRWFMVKFRQLIISGLKLDYLPVQVARPCDVYSSVAEAQPSQVSAVTNC